MFNNNQAGDGKPSPASPLRSKAHSRWRGLVRLALGIALIIAFIGGLTNLERVTGKSTIIETLREKDIYVGAWFWDYVDEVAEATSFMRGRLKQESGQDQED
ncbi:hypothetical protein [Desulfonatronum thioautotrophicum]|uniref:hypothetical protein n=1 Tax=Desulfonatronum thioautotrophicum TaxID=617001 RepID=UPI0005EB9359|nr:hypothetical protein [Desulfonatronum thioautotrophicum]